MARIKDVAALAGVAPSVVSRLLNEDPTLRIRPETRARVRAAAETLQYTPNRAARALRRARSGTLGMALRDLANPVYSEILAGAAAEANRMDYVLMVADVDALSADGSTFRRVMHGGVIDGLMLQRDGLAADQLIANIAETAVPLVILNERVPGPTSGVAVDDEKAAVLATEHLLALGHTRIGHLSIDGGTTRSTDRRSGWEKAMRAAGLEPRPEFVAVGGARPETGRQGMVELMARPKRLTAVVAGSVLPAIGALTAAHEAGLVVPDDLSIVGLNDSWLAEHVTPPLTVVRQPLRDLGEHAVRLLVEQIEGATPRQLLLTAPEPRLVERRSTAPPRSKPDTVPEGSSSKSTSSPRSVERHKIHDELSAE